VEYFLLLAATFLFAIHDYLIIKMNDT